MHRRDALEFLFAAGTSLAWRGGAAFGRHTGSVAAIPKFEQPLRMPTVLEPVRRTEAGDEYDIVLSAADHEIIPGRPTRIRGYQGLFPGPTIRAMRGRTAIARFTNHLNVPTVVHLHGGITPSDSDGFAADTLAPGESRTFRYPNIQRAATLWYHDHAMGHTGENIYRGLAGFYLVHDEEELALGLPTGEFDVPLLIQDRTLNPDGSLHYDADGHLGFAGDVMLVNGVPWPRMDVATHRYRFRLLNGSNSRQYRLGLTASEPFTLIGTDGGLLPEPVQLAALPLSPGERAEIIVDFGPHALGTQVFLLNAAERARSAELMRFDVTRRERDDSAIPARLSDPGFLARPTNTTIRTWELHANFALGGFPPIFWSVNSMAFDPNRSDAQVRRGQVELWHLHNHAPLFLGRPHPIHVHGAHFQIVERNGVAPFLHERGWKDTVALERGDNVLVLIRFEPFTGRYLLHCHNLEHEDRSMMARFDVV